MRRKVCVKCKQEKLLTQFSTAPKRSDGRRSRCKACRAEDRRAYLRTPKGKAAAAAYVQPSLSKRYAQLRSGAKKRGYTLALSMEDYEKVVKGKSCTYCGGELPKTGHGLDRSDNSRGYLRGNVVPCCSTCNKIKGSWFTPLEMIAIMDLVKGMRAA